MKKVISVLLAVAFAVLLALPACADAALPPELEIGYESGSSVPVVVIVLAAAVVLLAAGLIVWAILRKKRK